MAQKNGTSRADRAVKDANKKLVIMHSRGNSYTMDDLCGYENVVDDVFSELDKNRQNALVKNLNPNFQTIITAASISDIDKSIIDDSLIINLEKRSV